MSLSWLGRERPTECCYEALHPQPQSPAFRWKCGEGRRHDTVAEYVTKFSFPPLPFPGFLFGLAFGPGFGEAMHDGAAGKESH